MGNRTNPSNYQSAPMGILSRAILLVINASNFARGLLCRRVLVQTLRADAGFLLPQAFEKMSPA
jgi:hypothetical protein